MNRIAELRILKDAILALGRTTGVKAHVQRGRADDAVVEFKRNGRQHRLRAQVKMVDRFEAPALVKAKTKDEGTLLVAPYITPAVAEQCRQLKVPFIDTAGNAYLEYPELLVFVVGQPRPAKLRRTHHRGLTAAGLRITFALLCRPELVRTTYREIAMRAGVALGTVGPVLEDLRARGFARVGRGGNGKLVDPVRLLEEWCTHYPVALRPKLDVRRFRADADRLMKARLDRLNAYWGGEPAAEKLTGYLRPAILTIYTREPIGPLVTAGRMRADDAGEVEVADVFWNFEREEKFPDVVPPVLAYADLMATHDGRNIEAARMIYEQRIAPAFHAADTANR